MNPNCQSRAVQCGKSSIEFSVERRSRKTTSISVLPDLSVQVVAPLIQTDSKIDLLVKKKSLWIRRQQLRFRDLHPLPTPKRYVSGETHRYMGRQYRLKIVKADKNHVALRRPFLVVETTNQSHLKICALVDEWFRNRASVVLNKHFHEAVAKHPQLKTPDTRLQIKTMARRWGSCSPSGTITLNPALVHRPPACIEYVVIHELCHRLEMNHGPNFLHLLTMFMPDWQRRQERLNRIN